MRNIHRASNGRDNLAALSFSLSAAWFGPFFFSSAPLTSTPHPEVLAPTGPARSGRPDDKLSASLEGCRPRRRGLHPSRLAALAPQDEVNGVSFTVLAARFFAPESCHGTARKLCLQKNKGRRSAGRRTGSIRTGTSDEHIRTAGQCGERHE